MTALDVTKFPGEIQIHCTKSHWHHEEVLCGKSDLRMRYRHDSTGPHTRKFYRMWRSNRGIWIEPDAEGVFWVCFLAHRYPTETWLMRFIATDSIVETASLHY